jgi:hypothetical protein
VVPHRSLIEIVTTDFGTFVLKGLLARQDFFDATRPYDQWARKSLQEYQADLERGLALRRRRHEQLLKAKGKALRPLRWMGLLDDDFIIPDFLKQKELPKADLDSVSGNAAVQSAAPAMAVVQETITPTVPATPNQNAPTTLLAKLATMPEDPESLLETATATIFRLTNHGCRDGNELAAHPSMQEYLTFMDGCFRLSPALEKRLKAGNNTPPEKPLLLSVYAQAALQELLSTLRAAESLIQDEEIEKEKERLADECRKGAERVI